MLKLNNDKTEFFVAGSKNNIQGLQDLKLLVGESEIGPSGNMRNLGVIFDSSLVMTRQVNSLVSCANYYLRNIGRIPFPHAWLNK